MKTDATPTMPSITKHGVTNVDQLPCSGPLRPQNVQLGPSLGGWFDRLWVLAGHVQEPPNRHVVQRHQRCLAPVLVSKVENENERDVKVG